MKWIQRGGYLWLLVGLLMVGVIISHPQATKLNQQTAQAKSLKQQLKTVKQASQAMAISDVDLTTTERNTAQQLGSAVSLMLGGIKSDEDWDNHQDEVKTILGEDLTNQLLASAKDSELNQWLIGQNIATTVACGPINDPEQAPVYIVSRYQYQGDNAQKAGKVIQLTVNLKTQTIIKATVSALNS